MHEQPSARRRKRPDTPMRAGRRAGRGARPRSVLLFGALLACMLSFAAQANAAYDVSSSPPFTFVPDEQGADDYPGQKDLNGQAVTTVPGTPLQLWFAVKWDDTDFSGGNTGDACALFDTDTDNKINSAVCVTISGKPAALVTGTPTVYTCGDGKNDRCTSKYKLVSKGETNCKLVNPASDPFHGAGSADTEAVCRVDLAAVGTGADLRNVCSYPSGEPTSDPSDCVLVPRDAFLKITKTTTTGSGDGTFPFTITGSDGIAISPAPSITTTNGSGSTAFISIRSTLTYSVKENVPANWAIDGTPSCTGASPASGNGTFNGGDAITGIDPSSDNQITCSFKDKKLTGAIKIVKKSGSSETTLKGAVFTVDGGTTQYPTGDDGTVCVKGLSINSSHSVTEITPPNGHSLPANPTQTVFVADAATDCTSANAVEAVFRDPVVPGSLTIHKTDGNGHALDGAEFTLYTNAAPTSGTKHGVEDTATTLKCVTVSGDCVINDIPVGEYWIVETKVPVGYADPTTDTKLSVTVGVQPNKGDHDEVTIDNAIEPGKITVSKALSAGGDATGTEFTLYKDNGDGVYTALGEGLPLGSCTTDANGVCDHAFTGLEPGTYWIVETKAPNGYGLANAEKVVIGLASGGDSKSVIITDNPVPGTITLHKTGIDGSLEGATFTLYKDAGTIGGDFEPGVDDQTEVSGVGSPCTTGTNGNCEFTKVPLGDYWVVETGVPDGYYAVDPQHVRVGLGGAPQTGDLDPLGDLADEPIPGAVTITKTDDAGNKLEGAKFTVYEDADAIGDPFQEGVDDQTAAGSPSPCTTDSNGECSVTDLPLGDYWVVETKTPAGYDTADPKHVHIGLGTEAGKGVSVPLTFVDKRQHRVVVLVCHEGTDTLTASSVKLGTETKTSLGHGEVSAEAEEALCKTGGASFGGLSGHTTRTAEITPGTH